MDKKKFEAQMKLHGMTGADVAKLLGIARNTFSLKLNEKGTEFSQSELAMLKNYWNLNAEEFEEIFFNKKVS